MNFATPLADAPAVCLLRAALLSGIEELVSSRLGALPAGGGGVTAGEGLSPGRRARAVAHSEDAQRVEGQAATLAAHGNTKARSAARSRRARGVPVACGVCSPALLTHLRPLCAPFPPVRLGQRVLRLGGRADRAAG